MKLNVSAVLREINTLYVKAKMDKGFISNDLAPEDYPEVSSDQIKSVITVFVEELNKVHERIDKLEKKT